MILQTVQPNKLGMSVFPPLSRVTPESAGGGLAGMGDVTINGTTLTTTQLLIIGAIAYLLLKR